MRSISKMWFMVALLLFGVVVTQPVLIAQEAGTEAAAQAEAPAVEPAAEVAAGPEELAAAGEMEEMSDADILKQAAQKLKGVDDKLAAELERMAQEYEEDYGDF